MSQQEIQRGAEAISLFCRLNNNMKRELPVRAAEMGLLIYIVKNEEPVTPIMAAKFFHVSKPMVAAMIRNLAKKDYLTKLPSAGDKRSVILAVSDKAVKLVEEMYEEYFKSMAVLIDGMGMEAFMQMVALIENANNVLKEEI